MKIARSAGATLVAIMALGLAAVSPAFAEPEFKPTGRTFTGTSGTNILKGGSNTVTCTSDTSSGTISNATLAGGVKVEFNGCKSSGAAGSTCTVKSTNTNTPGIIITNTLHGVLGLILPKGTGSGVGLLLLPVANKQFFTLESNTCTEETLVTGNVAAELTPTKEETLNVLLKFQAAATAGESIKDFDLSTGGLVLPLLEAFGREASEAMDEKLTFLANIEIT
jgi:hypothetical protein